jgi:hypothetical protein
MQLKMKSEIEHAKCSAERGLHYLETGFTQRREAKRRNCTQLTHPPSYPGPFFTASSLIKI